MNIFILIYETVHCLEIIFNKPLQSPYLNPNEHSWDEIEKNPSDNWIYNH